MKNKVMLLSALAMILVVASLSDAHLPKVTFDDISLLPQQREEEEPPEYQINFDICDMARCEDQQCPLILVAKVDAEYSPTTKINVHTNEDECGIDPYRILQPVIVILVWRDEAITLYVWNWYDNLGLRSLDELNMDELEAAINTIDKANSANSPTIASLFFMHLSKRLIDANPIEGKDIAYLKKEDFPQGAPIDFIRYLKMTVETMVIVSKHEKTEWVQNFYPVYIKLLDDLEQP